MKITIRRGTSGLTFGFGVKWKVFADNTMMGRIRDKNTISFDVNTVDTINISALFLGELVIPLKGITEDVEIRCFIVMGMWKSSIYAYALAGDKYLGEYGF